MPSNLNLKNMVKLQLPDMINHASTAGMMLCIRGKAKLLVNGKRYDFVRGSLCFLSPLIHIEILSISKNCDWEFITDTSDNMFPVMRYALDSILRNQLFKKPCLQLQNSDISRFIGFRERIELKRKQLSQIINQQQMVLMKHNIQLIDQYAMSEFLLLFFSNQTLNPTEIGQAEKTAYDFIDRVQRHYVEHRDIVWYAEQAFLSPNYFTQVVRKTTGCTPGVWIQRITIANAKQLLRQPNKSVKEVAAELNFPEQFTFRKYFHRYTGMSPKEYQKEIIKIFEDLSR